MERYVMTPPPSPFVRQHSQGSDGAVVQRRSLCFTPRSVSLPMTPTVHYSQRLSFQSGNPTGFPVPGRSGSMTIPAASSALPLRQFSHGASVIPHITPKNALHSLQLGNSRFLQRVRRCSSVPPTLCATIIACTDCPKAMEVIFDAQPGSLFVATTRGCYARTDEGLLKKIELGAKLGSSLILVLGHKGCMTLLHAAQRFLAYGEVQFPTIQQAASDMGPCGDASFVCDRAMTLNVIDTIKFLLTSSAQLREQVQTGKIEIHGSMFDPFSGGVHFMGPIPGQAEFLLPRKPTEAYEKAAIEAKSEGRCEVRVFKPESELTGIAGNETATVTAADQKDPVVEKARDSEVSHTSQGTRGTPATDCEQWEPTSSQEDEADLLEKSEAPGSSCRPDECETGTEPREHELPMKDFLRPEESQISEESGDSGTTDAPSSISHVSDVPDEHTSSMSITAHTVTEVLPSDLTDRPNEHWENMKDQADEDVKALAKNESKAAEGEVILGPYFAAACDLWKHAMAVGNPALQLLRQNLEQWSSTSRGKS